jgi:hypothetical protein
MSETPQINPEEKVTEAEEQKEKEDTNLLSTS